jgi:hypothetical protein
LKAKLNTSLEFRRFDSAMRQLLTVSKQELQARIEADPHKTGKRKPKVLASGPAVSGKD